MAEGSIQPVHLTVMRNLVDKLIYNPVYTNGATDDFQLRVCRVLEYEMIRVEMREFLSANATSHLPDIQVSIFPLNVRKQMGKTYSRNMINIRLLHHRAHGPLDRSILKLEICVLIPYLL